MTRHTHALHTHLGRAAAVVATVVGLSALTPRPAAAQSDYCASIAVGTYNAWYNTTGSRFLASTAARETYSACVVAHAIMNAVA